jgi:DNA-directed RNA polymerase subunit N (RpoN/RPB10)
VRRVDRARRRANAFWAAIAGMFLLLAVSGGAVYAYEKLLQSEEHLYSAIEIAYGFVAETTAILDRFGVPSEVTVGLLRRAEAALNDLIARGANSNSLRYRKALMLVRISDSYDNLGHTDEALIRATEAITLLQNLVPSNQIKILDQLFIRRLCGRRWLWCRRSAVGSKCHLLEGAPRSIL